MSHFAKPWFRKGRGWFLELGGKQIKLADEEKEAFERYHQIMAGQAPSTALVSGVIDTFLAWCQTNRDPKTYLWYKIRCQSFWDFLKRQNLHFLAAEQLKPQHL